MCVGPELALAAEAAPELLGMTGAAALSPFAAAAPEAFAAEAAPALVGLGGFLPTVADEAVGGLLGPQIAGQSALLGGLPTVADESFGGMMGPQSTPWLSGTAAEDAVGGMKGPKQSVFNAKNAMLLGRMAGMVGGQAQGQQGLPQDYGNPNMRPAMLTQQQITKKWLLKNDPNTYRRMYGEPQQGT